MSFRVPAPAGGLGLVVLLVFAGMAHPSVAQTTVPSGTELPVTRIALFSSGVGYFEHEGRISGDAVVPLSFRVDEVDDALKSLTIRSGDGGGSPSVSYPSLEDETRALKAFRVDLSGSPETEVFLSRLRGVSLSLDLSEGVGRTLTGRVLGVERRIIPSSSNSLKGEVAELSKIYLNLLTQRGYESIPLEDIAAFRFTDPALSSDFDRAVEYLASARDKTRTALSLSLPGVGSRTVSFGYVVAAPVWKATYRLDLSGTKPSLQGWAAVDNATDRDWRGVTLSLVSGRPVSFIQNLYAPVYVDRPVVPLSIAGSAVPRAYAQGLESLSEASRSDEEASYGAREAPPAFSGTAEAFMKSAAPAPRAEASGGGASRDLASQAFQAARSRAAGDQFEFTIPHPVDLDRGRSALLPLVAGGIDAERVTIYTSGSDQPALGARLNNTSGMKLPAGPITVFDEGVYAGDALLDFLNEKDQRLIAFGDDLSVTVAESEATSRETVGVSVLKGVLTFNRRVSYSKTYTFQNASDRDKNLVVEHPERPGAELYQPTSYLERVQGRYRFSLPLRSGGQASLTVVERTPAAETVVLGTLNVDALLRFSSSSEIPPAVKSALSKAAELKRVLEDHGRTLSSLQTRRSELTQDQERIRANLESLGRQSTEGKKYISRLLEVEAELDRTSKGIEETRAAQNAAQTALEKYLAGLTI